MKNSEVLSELRLLHGVKTNEELLKGAAFVCKRVARADKERSWALTILVDDYLGSVKLSYVDVDSRDPERLAAVIQALELAVRRVRSEREALLQHVIVQLRSKAVGDRQRQEAVKED